MSIPSINIESGTISEYINSLRIITDGMEDDYWARGHSDANYKLLPSAFRKLNAQQERDLTNRFRARAAIRYAESPNYDEIGSWLSLMQHYGLPTRLLDWSRSPLVAAYFAVEELVAKRNETPSSDCCVWLLQPYTMNTVEINSPHTPSICAHECERFLVPAFSDKYGDETSNIAVMSSETDLRMFVQQGSFTLHAAREDLAIRPGAGTFLRKIVIKKGIARDFANEIRALGVRRGDIFPDLSKLATELIERWA